MPLAGRRHGGFVLVATLWILAAITIGAAYLAEQVDRARLQAAKSQDLAGGLVALENTRSEILFRLAVSGLSIYGLGRDSASAMRLDDTPYSGTDDDLVRLQDNRGLLNLNFVERSILFNLLAQFGVGSDAQGPMLDALLDYIDTDDFRRLNGAESREYEAIGLPPPPNDFLFTPYQLQSVIGWQDRELLWTSPRFLQLVTTARVTGIDPNTAPREVLASLPGSNAEVADMLIQSRRAAPFVTLAQLLAAAPSLRLDEANTMLFPSGSVRVTQQSPRVPWLVQFSITSTPTSPIGPWRVDYYARTPIANPTGNETKPLPLPERAALPATGPEAF